jgi:hypothetical protein
MKRFIATAQTTEYAALPRGTVRMDETVAVTVDDYERERESDPQWFASRGIGLGLIMGIVFWAVVIGAIYYFA